MTKRKQGHLQCLELDDRGISQLDFLQGQLDELGFQEGGRLQLLVAAEGDEI